MSQCATHASEPSSALVTPLEAARFLNVSRSTVYQLLDSGKLPSIHVLRCRRIRRADLEQVIADGIE